MFSQDLGFDFLKRKAGKWGLILKRKPGIPEPGLGISSSQNKAGNSAARTWAFILSKEGREMMSQDLEFHSLKRMPGIART